MKNTLAIILGITMSLILIGGKYHQWLAEELGFCEEMTDLSGALGGLLIVAALGVFAFVPNWENPKDPK